MPATEDAETYVITREMTRDEQGRFLPGDDPPRTNHRKAAILRAFPCPARLKPIQAIWAKLATAARDGDVQAGLRLVELYTRYAGEDERDQRPPHLDAYTGLPSSVGQVCWELDTDVEHIVRRHVRGLPCTDVEHLVAEAALEATGQDGSVDVRARDGLGLHNTIVEAVQRARQRGEIGSGPVPETWRARRRRPAGDAEAAERVVDRAAAGSESEGRVGAPPPSSPTGPIPEISQEPSGDFPHLPDKPALGRPRLLHALLRHPPLSRRALARCGARFSPARCTTDWDAVTCPRCLAAAEPTTEETQP